MKKLYTQPVIFLLLSLLLALLLAACGESGATLAPGQALSPAASTPALPPSATPGPVATTLAAATTAAPVATAASPASAATPTATQAAPSTATQAATATAAPAPAEVNPLRVSANNRYLIDKNNNPVFFSGDAAWSLIAQPSKADAEYYFQQRKLNGFNLVLANLIEHKYAGNAPSNYYKDAPFSGKAFSSPPNEAYFAHADYVINLAAKYGFTVLLAPVYLGYVCGDEGWCGEVKSASLTDMQNWGQYVGNRYRNYDNIIWVVGADADPAANGVQDKLNAFVTGLLQKDNRHLLTAHNANEQMAVTPWPDATWLNVNNIYTYNPTYLAGQAAYAYTPTKPFFQIESSYENEHGSTNQSLRAQAYWSVLSGAFGQVFGACPTWGSGNSGTLRYCGNTGVNWKSQLNSAAAASMLHMKNVFSGRPWYNLVPDTAHQFLTEGYGSSGGSDYATAGLSAGGKLGMVYSPVARTMTLNLAKFSGPVTAQWYDPANGSYTAVAGGPFNNSGTRTFTPAGKNSGGDNDWVLVLEAP